MKQIAIILIVISCIFCSCGIKVYTFGYYESDPYKCRECYREQIVITNDSVLTFTEQKYPRIGGKVIRVNYKLIDSILVLDTNKVLNVSSGYRISLTDIGNMLELHKDSLIDIQTNTVYHYYEDSRLYKINRKGNITAVRYYWDNEPHWKQVFSLWWDIFTGRYRDNLSL